MNQLICIETGAVMDSKLKIEKQAKKGCEQIKKLIFQENGEIVEEFQFGFHFIGDSQGGLIVRQIFEDCPEIREWVATITTNGTPNLGVDSLPDLHKFGLENNPKTAAAVNAILTPIQAWVIRFRSERDWTFLQYLNHNKKYSKFIEKLNLKATGHYDQLDMFNSVMYGDDFVVQPRNSATFGADFDETSQKWQPFSGSRFASELGFGRLHPFGGVSLCFAEGTHLNLSYGEYQDYQFLYEDDCTISDDRQLTRQQIRELYKKCIRRNRQSRHWKGLNCHTKNLLSII